MDNGGGGGGRGGGLIDRRIDGWIVVFGVGRAMAICNYKNENDKCPCFSDGVLGVYLQQ